MRSPAGRWPSTRPTGPHHVGRWLQPGECWAERRAGGAKFVDGEERRETEPRTEYGGDADPGGCHEEVPPALVFVERKRSSAGGRLSVRAHHRHPMKPHARIASTTCPRGSAYGAVYRPLASPNPTNNTDPTVRKRIWNRARERLEAVSRRHRHHVGRGLRDTGQRVGQPGTPVAEVQREGHNDLVADRIPKGLGERVERRFDVPAGLDAPRRATATSAAMAAGAVCAVSTMAS
ncbi:hypothetical protein [Salinispora arenicola]|uniref:hypothetical protein n=1 Tax=Salinispora arenicola TaxID=168697 RepID=UPI0027DCB579|nr:hypothetical protein [Salinispora arenicola]